MTKGKKDEPRNDEPPPKKPRVDEASGKGQDEIRVLLGLPLEPAPRPEWPTEAEIASGKQSQLSS